ncbi:MAG TPA: MFS transporter [Caulobacteraceae bacterium]|nr:MFS transporter [Caulobacteraceae bacterium]
MAFFANEAVNRVNIHSAIQAAALGAGGVFFVVFLLRSGLSPPAALTALAFIFVGRLAVRPLTLPLAKRFGLKPMLIFGTLMMSLQYPALALVHGVGPGLAILIAASCVGDVFYWVNYNSYFAAIGDDGHRGHQIGAREALVAVVGIIAPLVGAWGLTRFGPGWTFGAVGLVQTLAAAPLLGVPRASVPQEANGAFKAAVPGIVFFAFDGWFDCCFAAVWQIGLFVSLGESFVAYGGAMALAAAAGAAASLLLGRHIDAGGGRRAVLIAYGLTAAVAALRAASIAHPALAVGANALGGLVIPVISPTIGAVMYRLGAASPCAFRFFWASEIGWDLGFIAACLIAAALTWAAAPIAVPILLALPAAGGSAIFLWRRYRPAMSVAVSLGGV